MKLRSLILVSAGLAIASGRLAYVHLVRGRATVNGRSLTAGDALMALDFAIDELGLYLVTHADDKEVLDLYWKYIALAKEGRARYQEQYGPLTQTAVTEGGYKWLNDPWPWDEGGSD